MTKALYHEIRIAEVIPFLWDITLSLPRIINVLRKKEYTKKFNPTISEEFWFLFDIWDYEEDTLYYQPKEVIDALVNYLKPTPQ